MDLIKGPKLNLCRVPNMSGDDLTLKTGWAGVAMLTGLSRYKKRYTGSRSCTVDINGKLWERSADLKKHLTAEQLERDNLGAKKGRGKLTKVKPRTGEQKLRGEDTKRIKTKGNYSVNKTEIRNRIHCFLHTIRRQKAQLYFWSISFPEQITDQLAYQAFNTWLTVLRQKKWLRNYLWVAERQSGERLKDPNKKPTNNIHFHIAIPHYLSVTAANRTMQTILQTYSKRGDLGNYSVYQCKRFNGVDIAKNRKTKKVTNFAIKKGSRSLTTYLTKYVTKNDGKFDHLAWHNSRGFSALFTGLTCTHKEFLRVGWDEKIILDPVIVNEYFLFFAWSNGPPTNLMDHLTDLNSYVFDRLGLDGSPGRS